MSDEAVLLAVANPANRRFELFRSAAAVAGITVVPWDWAEMLAGHPPPTDQARWLRIDSPGEDPAVHRLLVGPDVDLCDVGPLALWYEVFCAAVDNCAGAVPEADILNPPDEIRVLFDKAACYRRLDQAGVAVPPALGPVASYDELRQAMTDRGWARVFVKPRHGSSACGVVALTASASAHRVSATTSAVFDGHPPRLRNRLGLRTHTDPDTVAAIVDTLAPDGLHVERWYPKLSVDGHIVDVRIVVIAGQPTHAVVRASNGPITNLHLGNSRGDLAAVIAAVGPDQWAAVNDTCRAVAACFPRSLHLGVDVLLAANGRGHVVAEVNAFGDLLPGITHQGRSTYEEEVDALISGRHHAHRAAHRAAHGREPSTAGRGPRR